MTADRLGLALLADLAHTRCLDFEAIALDVDLVSVDDATPIWRGTCPSCTGLGIFTMEFTDSGVAYECQWDCTVEQIRNAIERVLDCHDFTTPLTDRRTRELTMARNLVAIRRFATDFLHAEGLI